MIIPLKNGAQVVIGECLWIPGVYLAGGAGWSSGVIVQPDELDQLIDELTRIRGLIAEREAETEQRKERAA